MENGKSKEVEAKRLQEEAFKYFISEDGLRLRKRFYHKFGNKLIAKKKGGVIKLFYKLRNGKIIKLINPSWTVLMTIVDILSRVRRSHKNEILTYYICKEANYA